jgi:hypothetical protein
VKKDIYYVAMERVIASTRGGSSSTVIPAEAGIQEFFIINDAGCRIKSGMTAGACPAQCLLILINQL